MYPYYIKNLFKSKEYKNPSLNKDCTEFEVNVWVISEFVLKKIIPITGIKPYPLNELTLMVSAVCRLNPTHIFEWGTHFGKSARIFYETAKHFKLKVQIHSIDLPNEAEHAEHPKTKRGIFLKGISDVKLYQGDGLDKSLQIYKKIKNKDRVKPLFFLDGDHEYKSVKRELEEITRNVKNANILVHDTFYQSGKSGYNIGPYKGIKELLSQKPIKFRILSTNIGLPGMTLLYNL